MVDFNQQSIRFQAYRAVGVHARFTSLGSAQTITIPTGSNALLIQATGQNVRIKLDEGTPTASQGFQIRAGDPPVIIPLAEGRIVKVIEETASAVLEYQPLAIG